MFEDTRPAPPENIDRFSDIQISQAQQLLRMYSDQDRFSPRQLMIFMDIADSVLATKCYLEGGALELEVRAKHSRMAFARNHILGQIKEPVAIIMYNMHDSPAWRQF